MLWFEENDLLILMHPLVKKPKNQARIENIFLAFHNGPRFSSSSLVLLVAILHEYTTILVNPLLLRKGLQKKYLPFFAIICLLYLQTTKITF